MNGGPMGLRWLSAPASDVAAAIDRARRGARPTWMPTIRQLIVHVNHCLWLEPERKIDAAGRRLKLRDRRVGLGAILGAIGWYATLAFLYVVPGLFAFAGFMSIVDGH